VREAIGRDKRRCVRSSRRAPHGPGNQPPQCSVIGLVDALDAIKPFLDRNAPRIDLHVFGDDARDSSETACNAQRIDIRIGRQKPVEHSRIEFIGFTVNVEIGPREVCEQQRRTEQAGRREQFIDVVILRAADRNALKTRLSDKFRWINAAAMGGIVNEGNGLRHGLTYLKKLVFADFRHLLPS